MNDESVPQAPPEDASQLKDYFRAILRMLSAHHVELATLRRLMAEDGVSFDQERYEAARKEHAELALAEFAGDDLFSRGIRRALLSNADFALDSGDQGPAIE